MARRNTINNKTQDLTIDPGSSGDSYVQYAIGGVNKYRVGVDDDDSDKFKISQGNALGSNDLFVLTSNGEITMPLQSAFCAYNSVTDTSETGDGTAFTVIFDTEVFDQNSDFDGTSTFTAPVTGRYLLSYTVFLVTDTSSGGTTALSKLVTSNRTYFGNNAPTRQRVTGYYGPNAALSFSQEIICDMDASDTATVTIAAYNDSKVDDIYGTGSPYTRFCGCLVA